MLADAGAFSRSCLYGLFPEVAGLKGMSRAGPKTGSHSGIHVRVGVRRGGLDRYAQGAEQPGHSAVEGGGEGQLYASLWVEVLGQRSVHPVGDVAINEGIGQVEGSPLGLGESWRGAPHRELGHLVLVNAGFHGHASVLVPLVL